MSRPCSQWEADVTPCVGPSLSPSLGRICSPKTRLCEQWPHTTVPTPEQADPMAPLHAPAAAAQLAAVGTAPNAAPRKSSGVFPARCESRRAFLQGVLIAVAGAGTLLGHVEAAPAASKRRAPPPPPAEGKEKKDPNMSGVQAKVMASRKRKEAMKEATAKLREKRKKPADAAAPTAVTKTQIKSAAAVVEVYQGSEARKNRRIMQNKGGFSLSKLVRQQLTT